MTADQQPLDAKNGHTVAPDPVDRVIDAIDRGARLVAAAILSTDSSSTRRMQAMMVLVNELVKKQEKTDG